MILSLIFLFTCYGILIVLLTIGFFNVKESNNLDSSTRIIDHKKTKGISFSVIIPFRNEVKNLPNLVSSFKEISYPNELVEYIFVDDNSTDDSVAILKQLLKSNEINTQIIKNKRRSNSPKKDAISTAIHHAKNTWIVTTDADCFVPKKWLKSFENFIVKNNPKMLIGPVNYAAENTFLAQFQLLDFMSLKGSTIGGFGLKVPFLCNGANLAYKKSEFIALNGFEGNDNIASGDDIFLFEKFIEKDKKNVHFIKTLEATVTTFPVKNFTKLMHQRVRWASKTSKLKSKTAKIIGSVVFLTNLSIVIAFFIPENRVYFGRIIAAKMCIDLILLIPTIRFYKHVQSFLKWYLLCTIAYPFFNVFIVIKSLVSNYQWKGREFKK
ncbi:glycosyltransferase family 2 protein [Polaribacter tangerinus]|uniref:glycosyltransferase family 2 protein n=1 Tax=Polaribacter tangerinus TaxID=1920034 RepID=UPI000B4B0176|nr:glycosyltransferase [Polaribacter tangerinus]